MFNSVESLETGKIKVNFQGEIIIVSIEKNDDEFSIAEKIIKKSSLK